MHQEKFQRDLSVLSWFVSSPTMKFVLSWEERVWVAPCAWLASGQTTGVPVLFEIVAQLLHLVVEQLLNPILFSSRVSRRSLVEAEVTCILFRIWLLPSEQLPEYTKLDVFREEWQRSILTDRTSILSSEKNWCRPNIPCSDVSSMLCANIVRDAVHSSRSHQDPCAFCPWVPHAEKYCLSFAQTLTSKYQSRIHDGV